MMNIAIIRSYTDIFNKLAFLDLQGKPGTELFREEKQNRLMCTEKYRAFPDGEHKATMALSQDGVTDTFPWIDIKIG